MQAHYGSAEQHCPTYITGLPSTIKYTTGNYKTNNMCEVLCYQVTSFNGRIAWARKQNVRCCVTTVGSKITKLNNVNFLIKVSLPSCDVVFRIFYSYI